MIKDIEICFLEPKAAINFSAVTADMLSRVRQVGGFLVIDANLIQIGTNGKGQFVPVSSELLKCRLLIHFEAQP